MLGQYGLLYALANEDNVDRLFILNTPLALNSKLRPELAAYKSPIPFLRPGNVSMHLVGCHQKTDIHGVSREGWLLCCPPSNTPLSAAGWGQLRGAVMIVTMMIQS